MKIGLFYKLYNKQQYFTAEKYSFLDDFFFYFSYFCSKHRLWVHVRTASVINVSSDYQISQ